LEQRFTRVAATLSRAFIAKALDKQETSSLKTGQTTRQLDPTCYGR
jgi:hypothetical protein